VGYGNAFASSAFLLGLAAQELRRDHLRELDPAFPRRHLRQSA
jgi:hypothetical protein